MSKKSFSNLKRKQSFTFKVSKHYKKLPKQVMLDHIHSENRIVEVMINKASSLAKRGKKNPSPYCCVFLGKRKIKSSTKLNTTDPVWKEVFEFDVVENQLGKLKVEVWHKKSSLIPFVKGDVFLGYCSFDLQKLKKDVTTTHKETLLGVECGEIELEITAHCFGVEETKKEEPKPSVNNISEMSKSGNDEKKTEETPSSNSGSTSGSTSNKRNKKERYKIQKILGSGGQGSVFLAHDSYLDKEVVLKRIICESFEDANLALQENKTLNHENIVHYTDVFLTHITEGQSKGKFAVCFIMDYCSEGDLSKYIKRRFTKKKYLELPKICDFSSQIIDGINFLHLNKIMHRDMKPHNVFLTNKWKTLKVGDFGFVRELDKTYLSTKCGSPGYMAPEVAEQKGYNTPADIWSIGVVLYELATLKTGKVHFVLATKDYSGYIEDIRMDLDDRVGEKGKELVDVICSCLKYEPEERPTIMELKKILDELKIKFPIEEEVKK